MSENGKKISINALIKYVSDNWSNMDNNVELVSSDEDKKISHNQIICPLKRGIQVKLSALCNNLDDIVTKLDQNLCRIGILTLIEELGDTDISLYSSVLWILKDGFSSYSKQQQSECVVEFVKTLKFSSQYMFNELNYKNLGWTEKQLMSDIKSGEVGTTVMRFLADYLHINIFILNMNDEQMYYAGSHPWIPYKKNVLLVRHDNNTFEPVFTENIKFFGYESKLVSLLLMKPFVVKSIKCNLNMHNDIEFKEGSEDLSKYSVHNDVLEEESEMVNKFDDQTDQSESEPDVKLEKNLNDMTLEELMVEAKNNNISTYINNGNKKIKKSRENLIDELKEHLDNLNTTESETDIKKSSNKSNPSSKTPKYKTFTTSELKELSKKCGISLTNNKAKKPKTKAELLEELDIYYLK